MATITTSADGRKIKAVVAAGETTGSIYVNQDCVVAGAPGSGGTLLAPGLYGPNHQHFMNVRLDMMVDGPRNAVYEVHSEAVPLGTSNPHGNAFSARATTLATEKQARDHLKLETAMRDPMMRPFCRLKGREYMSLMRPVSK